MFSKIYKNHFKKYLETFITIGKDKNLLNHLNEL